MNKNCLTCKHFAWWDGDYCCVTKMKIICNAPKGEMNKDIIIYFEKNKNCKKWSKGNDSIIHMYEAAFNNFINKQNENTSSS